MVPLLQSPMTNPHATLITLFMNAIDENLTEQDEVAGLLSDDTTLKRLLQYLPPPKFHPPLKRRIRTDGEASADPAVVKIVYARASVATYDHIFER